MTALQDAPRSEPEVLIEEARRRQRRRRASLTGLAALLVVGAVIVGLDSGGSPPAAPRLTARGGGPSAQSLTASWHEVGSPSAYIAPGAQVTTAVDWHGKLLAAGWGPGDLASIRCAVGCNPVVWMLRNGRWRRVLRVSASGSLAAAEFVATRRALLLFSGGMAGTLWRSTDGRHWHRVRLPGEMGLSGGLQAVASNGTEVVASFGNRFAGGPSRAYGESDPVWTSNDGIHWRRDAISGDPDWNTLIATRGGFLAAGIDRGSGRSLVWKSTNGFSWSATPVDLQAEHAYLAAGANGVVLESLPVAGGDGRAQLWSLRDAGTWTRATVAGEPPTSLFDYVYEQPVFAVSRGFIALGGDNHRFWWSQHGRNWTRLTLRSPLKSEFQPAEASVDGNSLLFIESARYAADGLPAAATTLWRLELSPS